ncbi:hypothetical protein [Demequina sp.]|uniref:hypothetical protein n=1 Tax=Demequina sp. TaxID=2050685 RepID=UPI0025B93804|nr:hypothetical protein [Demequina sp.]
MRDLREVLQGSFESHADALGNAGRSWGGLAARSTRDTRNRRAWRAGAASTVAAAAAVGIVATAMGVVGGGGGGDALNPAQRLVMDDPYSLGECAAYVPANAEVLPDGYYIGRAYVDSASGFVVAVTPDGTVTRVQPGPNGDYPFDFGDGHLRSLSRPDLPNDMPPLVGDYTQNSGGGDIWVDAALDSYAWTRVVPAPAPDGVNLDNLWKTLAITLTGGGAGYDPGAVPDGATTDFVAGYTDGREDTGALLNGGATPSVREDIDTNALEYVALRVTLADGSKWELRFDYTPENIPDLPCQPTPPSGPFEWPSQEQTAAAEAGASEGATSTDTQAMGEPLSGPESEVFQCEAPPPADLENSGDVTARLASGEVMISDPDTFDVGEDGLMVDVTAPLWEMDPKTMIAQTPRVTGWQPTGGSQGDGPFYGNLTYLETVAVSEGAIVGVAGEPVVDWTANGVGGASAGYKSPDTVNLRGGFIAAFNGIRGTLQPCGYATSADLADAQLAVLYGFGPDVPSMSYGWTLVAN